MIDTVEERLADLEQLVLRQAERIAALEERLDLGQRVAAVRALRSLKPPEDEAA